MRKLFSLVTVCLFSLNAFAGAALGDICIQTDDVKMSGSEDTAHSGDMPCHDEPEKEENNKGHCDGVCMCIHLCHNHINIFSVSEELFVPLAISGKPMITDELMTSIILSPPYKPPKVIS